LQIHTCRYQCTQKKYKKGDFVSFDDFYSILSGNHFAAVQFQDSKLGRDITSSDNHFQSLDFNRGFIGSFSSDNNVVYGQTLFAYIKTDSLNFQKSSFGKFGIIQSKIKGGISLLNDSLKNNSLLNGTIGGKLTITGLIMDKNTELDLRGLKSAVKEQTISFYTDGKSASHVNMIYNDFHLCFNAGVSNQDKVAIYSILMDNFVARHQTENQMLLDKELQSFRYRQIWLAGPLVDWTIWAWWDYGYSRIRVFLCTIVLLFALSLINIGLYQNINDQVYKLDNFEPDFTDMGLISKSAKEFYFSFIYTAAVFSR
jgi:hypothetical protein